MPRDVSYVEVKSGYDRDTRKRYLHSRGNAAIQTTKSSCESGLNRNTRESTGQGLQRRTSSGGCFVSGVIDKLKRNPEIGITMALGAAALLIDNDSLNRGKRVLENLFKDDVGTEKPSIDKSRDGVQERRSSRDEDLDEITIRNTRQNMKILSTSASRYSRDTTVNGSPSDTTARDTSSSIKPASGIDVNVYAEPSGTARSGKLKFDADGYSRDRDGREFYSSLPVENPLDSKQEVRAPNDEATRSERTRQKICVEDGEITQSTSFEKGSTWHAFKSTRNKQCFGTGCEAETSHRILEANSKAKWPFCESCEGTRNTAELGEVASDK